LLARAGDARGVSIAVEELGVELGGSGAIRRRSTGPADAAVQSDELRAALHRAIAALPEHYREVLALRSQHHLSYPEIASALDIPLKTVESRVTRAFSALRKLLARHR
jgi:RNA polymerase sigma-70 factor (ECF subfamily)